MSERSPHSTRRQADFNVIEYEKFVGMVSDSTLLVTLRNHSLLNFSMVTKNSYKYVKRHMERHGVKGTTGKFNNY